METAVIAAFSGVSRQIRNLGRSAGCRDIHAWSPVWGDLRSLTEKPQTAAPGRKQPGPIHGPAARRAARPVRRCRPVRRGGPSLDTTFGLGAVGIQDVDIEVVQGAPELGQAGPADRPRANLPLHRDCR